MSNDELACTYAALILHDGGVAVTAAALTKVCKEAGVAVTPFWPNFFEKVLKTQNLDNLILNAGAPAPSAAPATTGATPAAAPAAKKEEPKKEEAKKPPPKKETSSDGEGDAFDLFG